MLHKSVRVAVGFWWLVVRISNEISSATFHSPSSQARREVTRIAIGVCSLYSLDFTLCLSLTLYTLWIRNSYSRASRVERSTSECGVDRSNRARCCKRASYMFSLWLRIAVEPVLYPPYTSTTFGLERLLLKQATWRAATGTELN